MARIVVAALAIWCVALTGVLADTPIVTGASPSQGFEDEETRVTLSGRRFPAVPGIGMLPGGPLLLGTADTAGRAQAVASEDGLVFVADGDHGLAVFDVNDPSHPVGLPGLAVAGSAIDVAVSNRLVCLVALAPGGAPGGALHVIDASNQAAPALLAELATPCAPQAVTIEGGYAYVVGGSAGDPSCGGRLDVFDVSVPDQARPAGFTSIEGTPQDVELLDDRAMIAAGEAGLQIVDVQDPMAPSLETGVPLPGDVHGVALAPGQAHLVGTEGLFVVGVDGPSAPSVLGSSPMTGTAIARHGRFELVAASDGLRTVDMQDPSSPRLAGYLRTPASPLGLAVEQDLASVVGGPDGLWTVGVHSPASPLSLVGSTDVAGPAVELIGERAYAADDLAIVHVFDVADPRAPARVGWALPFPPLIGELGSAGLHRQSDLLYVGRWWGYACTPSGLCLPPGSTVRILDPAGGGDPELVSLLFLAEREIVALAPTSDRLYLLGRGDGTRLDVYDTTNPASPVSLAAPALYGESTAAFSLAAQDDLLLLPVRDANAGACRLDLFDVADPGAPALRGSCPMSGCAPEASGVRSLAVAGDRVIVIGTNPEGDRGWLGTFDIGDPSHPTELAHLTAEEPFVGLRLDGDRAFVATARGLDIVDVNDLSRPFLSGRYEVPGDPKDLVVGTQHAFLAGDELRALRLNPPLEDTLGISSSSAEFSVPPLCQVGPYHLRVTGDDGAFGVLPNGFRACVRRELSATLLPLIDPSVREVHWPLPWTLTLAGDAEFFGTYPSHEARVALPELPEETDLLLRPGDGSGRETVDITLLPAPERAVVHLSGDDPAALARRWQQWLVEGGVPLAHLGAATYGPVELMVASTGSSGWAGRARHRGMAVARRSARYRYELEGGQLRSARAWGAGADLNLVARGVDGVGCESTSDVSFRETWTQLCLEIAAAHPELALRCERTSAPAVPGGSMQLRVVPVVGR